MARLVPARPLFDTADEETVMLTLEAELDDDHVVFQRRPVPGYTVIHPIRGACVVTISAGVRTWDPDTEGWRGIDPAATARIARSPLSIPIGSSVRTVTWLVETQAPQGEREPGFLFAGEGEMLLSFVIEALSSPGSHAPGEAGIDAVIQALSPGAARYEAGTVTEAQRGWRQARGDTQANTSTLLAPTTTLDSDFNIKRGLNNLVDQALPVAPLVIEKSQIVLIPSVVLASSVPTALDAQAPDLLLSDPLLVLISRVVNTAIPMKKFLQGIEVWLDDVVAPDFLLPAVIIAAAEDWAPVVFAKGGNGGYHVRLRSDPEAVLGYRVTSIRMSTPFLMILPVADKLRRCINNEGEANFDGIVAQFARFLSKNQVNIDLMGEIDVRLAEVIMKG